VSEIPYVPQPTEFPATYAYGPDSFPQSGVPSGTISEHELTDSHVFPGTCRSLWVYVPAQYDEAKPAALMVFQDGQITLDPDGEIRAGVVFDNLIHRGEMPVTIGVFVDPGEPGNRNAEYDAFDDVYATFLLEEILPTVLDRFTVTDDPEQCAIGGGSSGGNCAFTAAWMRPDRFRRVLCTSGSFVQMPGGNVYPELIATSDPKPLRIFLGAESHDLNYDEPDFNWFSSNLRIAAALAERGYDFRLVVGDATHGLKRSGVLLPDALRWLWRS
jgi:enterochelin esterase family protein